VKGDSVMKFIVFITLWPVLLVDAIFRDNYDHDTLKAFIQVAFEFFYIIAFTSYCSYMIGNYW
jgi:hypothetical protein